MNNKAINIDSEILGGTPVFNGTRVPIKNLFDYLETGETIETFLEDFEGVTKEQVVRVLEISEKLINTSTEVLNENFARCVRYKAVETTPSGTRSVYRYTDEMERFACLPPRSGPLDRHGVTAA